MKDAVIANQFDVLFVGAGPASLSCAIYLKKLINENPEAKSRFKDIKIGILEKSSEIGDHTLSGALFDNDILRQLIPDFDTKKPLPMTSVKKDRLAILTKKYGLKLPPPPMMSNKGCSILSVGEFTRFLALLAEDAGIEIYTEEPANEILISADNKVEGVVTKDKGLTKEGTEKVSYAAGEMVTARITLFGEGSRGYLTQKLADMLSLDRDKIPQGHAVGLKEVWRVKNKAFENGLVLHTMGYPLGVSNFGGGFVYNYDDDLVSIGLVISLDYKDPKLSTYDLFQRWKQNPDVAKFIQNGERICYGAKCISEGGFYAIPKYYGDGFLLIGESAGFLNSFKLKGIPMAIQSGIFAAETVFDALLKDDFTEHNLSMYKRKIDKSWMYKELWKARNFHQGFHKGLIPGFMHTGFQFITGGRGLKDRFETKPDFECMKTLSEMNKKEKEFVPDEKLTFDKMTNLYASGTQHEEDQPCHLKIEDPSICIEKCLKEYGAPCERFCPAKVYEIVTDDNDEKKLQINPTNCLHCKTCEIKDPYGIIKWVPPEGGGGPRYGKM